MFKWDKLIKNNKLSKNKDYVELEDENPDTLLYSEDEIPPREESVSNNEEEYEIVEIDILPAKIICPDCGGITLEGLEFCDKCGGEI